MPQRPCMRPGGTPPLVLLFFWPGWLLLAPLLLLPRLTALLCLHSLLPTALRRLGRLLGTSAVRLLLRRPPLPQRLPPLCFLTVLRFGPVAQRGELRIVLPGLCRHLPWKPSGGPVALDGQVDRAAETPARQHAGVCLRNLQGGLLLLLLEEEQGNRLGSLYAAAQQIAARAHYEGPGSHHLHALATALVWHEAHRAHDKENAATLVDTANSHCPSPKCRMRRGERQGIHEGRKGEDSGADNEHGNGHVQHISLLYGGHARSDLLGMLEVKGANEKDKAAGKVQGLLRRIDFGIVWYILLRPCTSGRIAVQQHI
mmetsp:Transcript_57312/g.167745  ORF Transcript_57312/g.167745 Transcript_57312/m.167745 type:complete len:314 (-) Transcript_57312:911-1852(-)